MRAPLSPKKIFESAQNVVKSIAAKLSPQKSPHKSPDFKRQALGTANDANTKISTAMRKLDLDARPKPVQKLPNHIPTTPPKRKTPKKPESPESPSPEQDTPPISSLETTFTVTKMENSLPEQVINNYRIVKRCLTTQRTGEIIGREEEYEKITGMIISKQKTKKGGSLYISGNPGTGKTACIYKVQKNYPVKIVNCMEACGSGKINNFYINIAKIVLSEAAFNKFNTKLPKTVRGIQKRLETEFAKTCYIMVLDEIDRLADTSTTVGNLSSASSTSISSISSAKSNRSKAGAHSAEKDALLWLYGIAARTRLILISIANTLDFTDRSMPELYLDLPKSSRPELINFQPYTPKELTNIIVTRLKECNGAEKSVLSLPVISYTSIKISKSFGDVRRVFDVLKRAVAYIELEARKAEKALPVTIPIINKVHDGNINDFQSIASPARLTKNASRNLLKTAVFKKPMGSPGAYGLQKSQSLRDSINTQKEKFRNQKNSENQENNLAKPNSQNLKNLVSNNLPQNARIPTIQSKSQFNSSTSLNISSHIVQNSQPSSSSSEDEDENILPTHQAILLLSIQKGIANMQKSHITFQMVKDCYLKNCKYCEMSAQPDSELLSMLTCLQDRAYIDVGGSNLMNSASLKKCKIGLSVEAADIKRAFQDKTLLSKLL
jgi:Cdc6-like AAA superfamily ATPase